MAARLRIGGASGYWGDAPGATAQLLDAGVDIIVYDYLAEITLSLLARARRADAARGFVPDFIGGAMAPNLRDIARRGVRIVSNAGGLNPDGCAAALRAAISEQGLTLRVAVVRGDDLTDRAADLAATGLTEMFSGAPFPDPGSVQSINLYLGAAPIAAALAAGADIVITGRCVDSAVTLGACMAEFGWRADDLDLLATGSMAGHLLECGAQATGGNFTDWRAAGDFARIGYPIAEISADGGLVITKPGGTGGIVSVASLGEQLVYEIGDPGQYALPDVTCDLRHVSLTQDGPDRVRVTGARGDAPPDQLKASITWQDGYRGLQHLVFYGAEAAAKAESYGAAVFAAAAEALAREGRAPLSDSHAAVIGAGDLTGITRTGADGALDEVTLSLGARHAERAGIATFFTSAIGLALSGPPGLCGLGAGPGKPSPVVRLFSALIDRSQAQVEVTLEGAPVPLPPEQDSPIASAGLPPPPCPDPAPPDLPAAEYCVTVPLIRLAWARSGDKGDQANIGVIARRADLMPYIWHALAPAEVAARFADLCDGPVQRHHMPGLPGLNLVLHRALGGGGIASLRDDPQGKGFAQLLLAMPVTLPADLARGLT